MADNDGIPPSADATSVANIGELPTEKVTRAKRKPRTIKPLPAALLNVGPGDAKHFVLALEKDTHPKSSFCGQEFPCAQGYKPPDGGRYIDFSIDMNLDQLRALSKRFGIRRLSTLTKYEARKSIGAICDHVVNQDTRGILQDMLHIPRRITICEQPANKKSAVADAEADVDLESDLPLVSTTDEQPANKRCAVGNLETMTDGELRDSQDLELDLTRTSTADGQPANKRRAVANLETGELGDSQDLELDLTRTSTTEEQPARAVEANTVLEQGSPQDSGPDLCRTSTTGTDQQPTREGSVVERLEATADMMQKAMAEFKQLNADVLDQKAWDSYLQMCTIICNPNLPEQQKAVIQNRMNRLAEKFNNFL